MLEWSEWVGADGFSVRLLASDSGLRAIDFDRSRPLVGARNDGHPVLSEAVRQLHAYAAGLLREFTLPLDMQGTEFQLRVWRALLDIPYGETWSYRDVAARIGVPQAVRAVGAANGANPLPIVVPCHRVIGSNGKLVGYGGGLALKRRLLALESGAVHQLWPNFLP